MGDNRSFSSPMSSRQLLWAEIVFFRFGFETLVMNRARSLIGSADLSRDLLAERHAGYKMRRVHRLIEGGDCPAWTAQRPSNTGEPSAGDQSITRGVGGSSPSTLRMSSMRPLSRTQQRHAFDQLHAIVGDDPGVRFQHLVLNCQPPMRSSSAGAGRASVRDQHVAERSAIDASEVRCANASGERKPLMRSRRCAPDGLRQHARRKAVCTNSR